MGVSVSLEPAPVRADLLTWRLLLQIWGDIVSAFDYCGRGFDPNWATARGALEDTS